MKTKKSININLLFVTTINYLTSFAIYITLPFLALYFYEVSQLTPAQIGLVIGIAPLFHACLGFWGGNISDRIGNIRAIICGILILIFVYISYTLTNHFATILFLGILLGIGKALLEPSMKALFSKSSKNENFSFRLRYFSICLAGITGPFIAIYISKIDKVFLFYLTSTVLAFNLCLVLFFWKRLNSSISKIETKLHLDTKKYFTTILKDKRLLILIMAGLCLYTSFSQFESIFPLAINEFSKGGISIFPILLIINSILGITFQIPISLICTRIKPYNIAILGVLFFVVSFAIFCLSGAQIYLFVIGTIVFTFGESLALPAVDILIDKIAPSRKKATYFGLAELRQLGFFVGPYFAGLILQAYNITAMYLFGIGILSLCLFFFYVFKRYKPL